MILISHRGNINGPSELNENQPFYIDGSLDKGYDVEIDVWYVDGVFYLGHDKPDHKINFTWIIERQDKLWVHCKNIESILFFKECDYEINYFWHEEDTITLTSKNYIWAYPGKQPIKDSIAVMPEIYNDDTTKCLGICSDYISNYLK